MQQTNRPFHHVVVEFEVLLCCLQQLRNRFIILKALTSNVVYQSPVGYLNGFRTMSLTNIPLPNILSRLPSLVVKPLPLSLHVNHEEPDTLIVLLRQRSCSPFPSLYVRPWRTNDGGSQRSTTRDNQPGLSFRLSFPPRNYTSDIQLEVSCVVSPLPTSPIDLPFSFYRTDRYLDLKS